jgi:hypothetical protein
MFGKIVVVTGANSGVGLETASHSDFTRERRPGNACARNKNSHRP